MELYTHELELFETQKERTEGVLLFEDKKLLSGRLIKTPCNEPWNKQAWEQAECRLPRHTQRPQHTEHLKKHLKKHMNPYEATTWGQGYATSDSNRWRLKQTRGGRCPAPATTSTSTSTSSISMMPRISIISSG
ncbi:hypothetical protein PABG_11854 [Paracoccidioides brasiliensis Pb03]|nr:hypothetical protein PABG_11854 [Paracoccidioides brasiliensis Pb03]